MVEGVEGLAQEEFSVRVYMGEERAVVRQKSVFPREDARIPEARFSGGTDARNMAERAGEHGLSLAKLRRDEKGARSFKCKLHGLEGARFAWLTRQAAMMQNNKQYVILWPGVNT